MTYVLRQRDLSIEHRVWQSTTRWNDVVYFPLKIREGPLKDAVEIEDEEEVQYLNHIMGWV
jgi:hypothetical protein